MKSRVITIVLLALTWFIMMLLADHPHTVERYYSDIFYRAVCYVLHPVLNLFPFSIGDLLYIAVVCYFIYAFIRLLVLAVKRKFSVASIFLLKLIIIVQSATVIFYLFWGMNYFRPSAAERLNLPDSGYTVADLKSVTSMLIDSANACRARVGVIPICTRVTKPFMKQQEKQSFVLAVQSANFRAYHPDIKPSLLTPLLNDISTSGLL